MNYRRSVDALHDKIVARLKRRADEEPRQYRRICCFCNKDLGPAIGNYSNDTHGMHTPPCPEAIAMGWGDHKENNQ